MQVQVLSLRPNYLIKEITMEKVRVTRIGPSKAEIKKLKEISGYNNLSKPGYMACKSKKLKYFI